MGWRSFCNEKGGEGGVKDKKKEKRWVKPLAEPDHLTAEIFYQTILPFLFKGII